MDDYKLCYVDGNEAWFTTAELKDQWGDDWNDAPYEHNAGRPYEWYPSRDKPQYKLKIVMFRSADLETPASRASNGNSAYSVEQINGGAVAWLSTSQWSSRSQKQVSIHAGCSIEEFKSLVKEAGGEVYVLEEDADPAEGELDINDLWSQWKEATDSLSSVNRKLFSALRKDNVHMDRIAKRYWERHERQKQGLEEEFYDGY